MDTLNKELEKLTIDYEVILKNDKKKFDLNEIKEKYDDIINVYNILNENIKQEIDIHPAGEWLLDNIYIIQEVYSVIVNELSSNNYKKFPKIQMNDGKIVPRIQIFAEKIIQNINEPIDKNILSESINKYQEIQKFTMFELWNLGIFLQIELINQIHQICGKIYISQVEKEKVQNMYERLIEQIKQKKSRFNRINKYLTINKKEQMKNTYIEYLAYILKKNGQKTNKYLQALEEIIKMSGKDLKDIIIKEHLDIANTKINIGKYILSMKNINNISFSEIFESTNEVEKNLKDDPLDIYRFMEYTTKEEYRNMIEKISKTAKVSEIYVSNIVLDLAKKHYEQGSNENQDNKKAHVGYYLIDKGINETYKLLNINKTVIDGKEKGKLYVYYKTMVSIVLNYVLVDLFYNNLLMKIISFIIIFVPVFFFVDFLMKKILLKRIVPKVIPKMELNYTIPNELKTIVIMPCIIENEEQIKEKLKKLEIYFLSNKSPNIYFCLLADPKQADTEKLENDEKIIKQGLEKINELNEKYSTENMINEKVNKNNDIKIFNFIYRKRKWNDGEQSYIGFERKRGYLRQFNKYILGEYIDDFILTTIDNKKIPDIKYVITLDSDTNLILNSAFEQIGAMSHILNKPYINEETNTVKNGYAIMQPQIGIDLEVSNTNKFTKIFANSSGIDFYANAISDIYQDICKSGIYTGKGIYDVKVFEEVLADRIKDNTILSHDLLEGELLNCGLITNTKLIDEYPKNYLSYAKRKKRWIRGDVQVLAYLKEKGLTFISKYKMVDNILRETLEIFLSIALLTNIIPVYLIILIYMIPYYQNIKQGIIELSLLPYTAYMEITSILKAIYRMKISHKKMLEWATFEQCEKEEKNGIISMYKNLFINIIFALLLIMFDFSLLTIVLSMLWIISPYIVFKLQKEYNDNEITKLKEEDKNYIFKLGKDTWQFFEDHMNEDTNYLIPDNYQENRKNKIVYRTSSTNIGLSLLACISAYDLNYITKEKLFMYIEKILGKIEELDKWNGHLYNWYDIKSKKPLFPPVISTVDSGNFIGYLYTLIGFLQEKQTEDKEQISNWIKRIYDIINKTDFSKLYSQSMRFFSIAYDESQNVLLKNYYDLLASEARQASYIAIAKKDVPAKHWANLGRTMTKIDNKNCLVSWSGTSFEYLMPNINMPVYKESILEKSCDLMIKAQIKYCSMLNIPWGISEAAFNLKDLYSNYQYKAFGVPWLGLKRGLSDEKVVSSYGSIMAINKYPIEVLNNIKNLESKEMYSKYGLYESIDFTKTRLSIDKEYEVVKTYMAHHQALILLSINNLFNYNILQKRFLKVPELEAAKTLLQEKMPEKVIVTKDNKDSISKENKIKYKDYMAYMKVEYDENNNINNANLNLANCISNNRYTVVLDKYGEGFSKFNNIYINRYKKDREMFNGIQLYFKEEENLWRLGKDSKGIEKQDGKNKFKMYSNRTNIEKITNNVKTSLTNIVSPNDSLEIRKVELENLSNTNKSIDVYMLFEPILSSLEQDYSHPIFNNLFLRFEYFEKENTLIVKRRKRNNDESNLYLAITALNVNKSKFEFEIDKNKIYKRGEVYVPEIVKEDIRLTNNVNLVTEPMVCLKNKMEINPREKVDLYYMFSVGYNKDEVINIINKNSNINEIERNIKLSKIKAEEENRYLGVTGEEELTYQKILKNVLLYNPYKQKEMLKYIDNRYQREDIWKYGISADLPIIYLNIEEINDIENVKQILKCYEYIRNKNINVDVVISFPNKLRSNVEVQVNNRHLGYLKNIKGGIYLLEKEHISKENLELIEILSNIYIDSKKGDIENIINDLEDRYVQENKNKNKNKKMIEDIEEEDDELNVDKRINEFEAEYINDGKEYRMVIDKYNRLPTVWCNIMANKNFGTVVTENLGRLYLE